MNALAVLGFSKEFVRELDLVDLADVVKARFKSLAQLHHPDKGGSADEFKRVRDAYECVGDMQGLQRERDRFARRSGLDSYVDTIHDLDEQVRRVSLSLEGFMCAQTSLQGQNPLPSIFGPLPISLRVTYGADLLNKTLDCLRVLEDRTFIRRKQHFDRKIIGVVQCDVEPSHLLETVGILREDGLLHPKMPRSLFEQCLLDAYVPHFIPGLLFSLDGDSVFYEGKVSRTPTLHDEMYVVPDHSTHNDMSRVVSFDQVGSLKGGYLSVEILLDMRERYLRKDGIVDCSGLRDSLYSYVRDALDVPEGVDPDEFRDQYMQSNDRWIAYARIIDHLEELLAHDPNKYEYSTTKVKRK